MLTLNAAGMAGKKCVPALGRRFARQSVVVPPGAKGSPRVSGGCFLRLPAGPKEPHHRNPWTHSHHYKQQLRKPTPRRWRISDRDERYHRRPPLSLTRSSLQTCPRSPSAPILTSELSFRTSRTRDVRMMRPLGCRNRRHRPGLIKAVTRLGVPHIAPCTVTSKGSGQCFGWPLRSTLHPPRVSSKYWRCAVWTMMRVPARSSSRYTQSSTSDVEICRDCCDGCGLKQFIVSSLRGHSIENLLAMHPCARGAPL